MSRDSMRIRNALRPGSPIRLPEDENDGPIISIDEPFVVPRPREPIAITPEDLFAPDEEPMQERAPVGVSAPQAPSRLRSLAGPPPPRTSPGFSSMATRATPQAPEAPTPVIPPPTAAAAFPETTSPAPRSWDEIEQSTGAATDASRAGAPVTQAPPDPPRPQAMPASTALPGEDEPLIQRPARQPPPDGLFGPTAEEREERRRADTRDRRLDIASNVFGTLGRIVSAIGIGSGRPGLGAIGAATNQVGRGIATGQGGGQRVRAQIAERLAGTRAEQAYNDQQAQQEQAAAQAATAAQRQAAIDQREARMGEAQIANLGARTAATQGDVEDQEFERASAAGDAGAMRGSFRALVNGLNDDSGLVQQWREWAASPEFDAASADTLRANMDTVRGLANRRGAGLLESGGGGSPGTLVWNGTAYVTRGGGHRAASPGIPAGHPDAATPAHAPRRARPSPPPADPALPPEPGAAIHLPDANERLVMAVRARGLDPATPAGLAYMEELRAGLAGPAGRQAEVQRIIADALESQGIESSIPGSIDRTEFRTLSREAAPIASRIHQLNPLIGVLHSTPDTRLAAALHGGATMASVAGAAGLRARIAAYMNEYFHDFGGANITPEERARYQTAFANDSIAVPPSEFVAAMRRAQRLNMREAEGIMNRATRNPHDVWEYYASAVLHPRRTP